MGEWTDSLVFYLCVGLPEDHTMPVTFRRMLLASAALCVVAVTPGLALGSQAAAREAALPFGLTYVTPDDMTGAVDVADEFIAAIEGGDGGRLLGALHPDTLIERITTGMSFSEEERRRFDKAMKATLGQVGAAMAAGAPDGIDASYRGMFSRRGRMHALIRLDLGEIGLNYFELELARLPDGSVAVYDWYDYAQAAFYSTSVRELGALSSGDPRLIETAGGVPGIDAEAAEAALRFMRQLQAGERAAALHTYHGLPAALRHAKPLLMQRAKLANGLGDPDEYHAAMSDLGTYHGEDPRLALVLVDYYLQIGDREKLFGALERMKWFMGVEDPGLINLEAAYYQLLGESELAEQRARGAIAREPGYEDPHWVLVRSLLSQKKHAQVTETLRLIELRFDHQLDPEWIATEPSFADYAESDSFRAWATSASAPAEIE
jgi:hypothetical protein